MTNTQLTSTQLIAELNLTVLPTKPVSKVLDIQERLLVEKYPILQAFVNSRDDDTGSDVQGVIAGLMAAAAAMGEILPSEISRTSPEGPTIMLLGQIDDSLAEKFEEYQDLLPILADAWDKGLVEQDEDAKQFEEAVRLAYLTFAEWIQEGLGAAGSFGDPSDGVRPVGSITENPEELGKEAEIDWGSFDTPAASVKPSGRKDKLATFSTKTGDSNQFLTVLRSFMDIGRNFGETCHVSLDQTEEGDWVVVVELPANKSGLIDGAALAGMLEAVGKASAQPPTVFSEASGVTLIVKDN